MLVRPLEAWAPRWLSPLAQAVALYVREGLMYWAAAGMALLSSFGIWRVVDQRAALLGRPPSKEQAPGGLPVSGAQNAVFLHAICRGPLRCQGSCSAMHSVVWPALFSCLERVSSRTACCCRERCRAGARAAAAPQRGGGAGPARAGAARRRGNAAAALPTAAGSAGAF